MKMYIEKSSKTKNFIMLADLSTDMYLPIRARDGRFPKGLSYIRYDGNLEILAKEYYDTLLDEGLAQW